MCLKIKTLLFLCLCLVASHFATAQYRYGTPYRAKRGFTPVSLRWGVGLTAYSGELALVSKPKNQNFYMNPNLNVAYERRLTHFISVRAEMSYFRLNIDKPVEWRDPNRALITNNLEGYLAIVHDIFPKWQYEKEQKVWNASVYAGLGILFFDNRNFEGKAVRKMAHNGYIYPPYGNVFPFGITFHYYLNPYTNVGLDFSYRYTITDYMDDFRDFPGLPSYNIRDGYMMVGLRVTNTLFPKLGKKGGYNYKGKVEYKHGHRYRK